MSWAAATALKRKRWAPVTMETQVHASISIPLRKGALVIAGDTRAGEALFNQQIKSNWLLVDGQCCLELELSIAFHCLI